MWGFADRDPCHANPGLGWSEALITGSSATCEQKGSSSLKQSQEELCPGEMRARSLGNYSWIQRQVAGAQLRSPLLCKDLFREISPLLGGLPPTLRRVGSPPSLQRRQRPLLRLTLSFTPPALGREGVYFISRASSSKGGMYNLLPVAPGTPRGVRRDPFPSICRFTSHQKGWATIQPYRMKGRQQSARWGGGISEKLTFDASPSLHSPSWGQPWRVTSPHGAGIQGKDTPGVYDELRIWPIHPILHFQLFQL